MRRACLVWVAAGLCWSAACGDSAGTGGDDTGQGEEAGGGETSEADLPSGEEGDGGKTDTGDPDTGQPDTGDPDTGDPDTGQPDSGDPDTGDPDTDQDDGGDVTPEPDSEEGGPDVPDTMPDDGGEGAEVSTDAEVTDTETSQGCNTDEQCQAALGDNACAVGECVSGTCETSDAKDGTACPGGVCYTGICQAKVCDAGDTVCSAELGLGGTAVVGCGLYGIQWDTAGAEDCNDGDVCNGDETCALGVCALSPTPFGVLPGCDDGNECTDDSCDPDLGCQFVNANKACDDGDACTAGDACIDGACVAGAPVDCVDGAGACGKAATCDSVLGCVASDPLPDGTACDDNNACTGPDVCTGGACLGGDVDCGAPGPCATVSCDTNFGCVKTNLTGPCDDGDPCTVGDHCSDGACVTGTLSCPAAFCELVGAADDEALCFVQLIRETAVSTPPTALQFDLQWDESAVSLVQFEDEFCIEAALCFVVPTPPTSLYPGGHQITVYPEFADAMGSIGVIVVDLVSGMTPITEAYFDDQGNIEGDPIFVTARFKLLAAVPPESASIATISGVVLSSASANEIPSTIENGAIVSH